MYIHLPDAEQGRDVLPVFVAEDDSGERRRRRQNGNADAFYGDCAGETVTAHFGDLASRVLVDPRRDRNGHDEVNGQHRDEREAENHGSHFCRFAHDRLREARGMPIACTHIMSGLSRRESGRQVRFSGSS